MFSSKDKFSIKKPSPLDLGRGRPCDMFNKPHKGEVATPIVKGESARDNTSLLGGGICDMRK